MARRPILEGFKLIEVSAFVAAPLGGATLAELGADVVRVDPPGGGIDAGRWPLHNGASLYWAGLNQGKRSVNVDLRSERGQQIVADLIVEAGACLTNLPLGGKPEFLVSDDAGHVFINITDKKEIVRVDARAAKIEARWPISDCEGAHGLAIDRANHRLFATCVNSKMVVVDSEKGTVLATLPIGKGSDTFQEQ